MQSLLHGSVSIFATKLNQSPAIGIQTEATPSIEIRIMKQGQTDITSQQDKNLDMVDEHMQLLDTIQEMVKTEVNKRIGESIRTEEKKIRTPRIHRRGSSERATRSGDMPETSFSNCADSSENKSDVYRTRRPKSHRFGNPDRQVSSTNFIGVIDKSYTCGAQVAYLSSTSRISLNNPSADIKYSITLFTDKAEQGRQG